jgi:hypothetical protein
LGYGVVFVQHSSDEKPDLIFAQSLNAFCVIIRWTFMCIFISLFCNNCISHPLVKLMQGKEKIKNKTKSLVCSFLLNNFNAKTCFPLKKTTNKHKKRKIKIKFYGFFFCEFSLHPNHIENCIVQWGETLATAEIIMRLMMLVTYQKLPSQRS